MKRVGCLFSKGWNKFCTIRCINKVDLECFQMFQSYSLPLRPEIGGHDRDFVLRGAIVMAVIECRNFWSEPIKTKCFTQL